MVLLVKKKKERKRKKGSFRELHSILLPLVKLCFLFASLSVSRNYPKNIRGVGGVEHGLTNRGSLRAKRSSCRFTRKQTVTATLRVQNNTENLANFLDKS